MCLILFANATHPAYPLVLAANRDESYARPTATAAFWQDDPRIFGGRDLEHGGTWLGVSRSGSFAAVTNFRDGYGARNSTHSRGKLVANFLHGQQNPGDYIADVRLKSEAYNGFNLLAGNLSEVHWYSNRSEVPEVVAPGVHGLSNHLLNTPWPKVERGKARLTELLDRSGEELIDALFEMLAEKAVAADYRLPETGVGLARERVLSPAFIVSAGYGTRSSTVVLVDAQGTVTCVERSFGEGGVFAGETGTTFELQPAASPASV